MKDHGAHVAYDHEAGCFRLMYPEARRTLTKEERPAVARASVSRLLAEAFGQPLSTGNTGLIVPSHLRKYVKR